MKDLFHNQIRPYYIYVIFCRMDGTAFIGKTYSKNPRARFNAHLRGECAQTRETFGPDCFDQSEITFQVLEALSCTGSDAYRHVVAWCRFFEDAGFELINAAGVVEDSEALLSQTQSIYAEVCAAFSLDEVLTRHVPMHQSPSAKEDPIPLRQLNLRVRQDVMDGFKIFCEERSLTQSDALRLLLLSQENCNSQALADSIQRDLTIRDAQISALQTSLHMAKEKLALSSQNVLISIIGQTVYQDLSLRSFNPPLSPLSPLSFRRAKQILDFSAYSYPGEAGSCYLVLDALVYGRGRQPALFVLGHAQDGTLIKLRWYPKKGFVGISPRSSIHAYRGSIWSVGYTVAKDGALDLIAAIPIDCPLTPALPQQYRVDNPSLDSIISNAQNRK